MSRLTPYGSAEQADNLAKVGKSKTPRTLAALMPSAAVAAKVGMVEELIAARGIVRRRNAQG